MKKEKKLDKLREVRLKNNYSFAQMAEMLNISKPYYWQIENGKRNLGYIMAIRIARILKTKPDAIFYDAFKDC